MSSFTALKLQGSLDLYLELRRGKIIPKISYRVIDSTFKPMLETLPVSDIVSVTCNKTYQKLLA